MSNEFSWRTGRSCIYKNHVHLVFVTKYRRGVFTDKMLDRVEEIISETCNQMDAELLEFNGEKDHIHLLINCPPKLAVANLVGKLKGKSSYYLRKEFWSQIKEKLWGAHFWSPSYCVISCGGATLEVIKQYIEDQQRPSDKNQIRQSTLFRGRKRDAEKNWI